MRTSPIPSEQLRSLQKRSDLRGLLRFAGHLAAMACAGWAYTLALRTEQLLPALLGDLALGFTLVTMFAAMHEAVHRTAFRTPWLNDAVGWLAGLLSFYNSSFFRHYHTWHHRFTQIHGKDPELDDPAPTSLARYALVLSGLPWWVGKLRTHARLALGRTDGYAFLNDNTAPAVVRSVRLQLAVYALAIAASQLLGRPYFALYWLAPVALAQPLLRAILLCEHTGCSHDEDPHTNTRTTHTVLPVRYLMWEMPFHAEHHRYPALPFFALREAHAQLGPQLTHVARRGYLSVHAALLRELWKRPTADASA